MIRIYSLTTALALIPGIALAADPQERPDDTWITVDGKVTEVSPSTFDLNYGETEGGDPKLITVEMDDWDSDADAYKLLEGDKVSVSGRIDDDAFEQRTIEAYSVYVENIGTYYFASAADEEDLYVSVETPLVIGRTTLQGVVTEIPGTDEFILNTGLSAIEVDCDRMETNPISLEGVTLNIGDTVTVSGEFDSDLFEGREFMAESLVIHRPR